MRPAELEPFIRDLPRLRAAEDARSLALLAVALGTMDEADRQAFRAELSRDLEAGRRPRVEAPAEGSYRQSLHSSGIAFAVVPKGGPASV